MIEVHIPTERFGFVEITYKDIENFRNEYPTDYMIVKEAQKEAEEKVSRVSKIDKAIDKEKIVLQLLEELKIEESKKSFYKEVNEYRRNERMNDLFSGKKKEFNNYGKRII